MAELSIHKQIQSAIKKKGRGAILSPTDFASFGNAEVVKKVLLRLENQGFLTRLAFGIYLYPKESKLLGRLTPTLEEIAAAIAKRDAARIIPTGAYALNKLGLSTQVPVNAVYLTDGASRKLMVGKRHILFKKTSPRNLAAAGPISGLVIQALKEIGDGNIKPVEERKILAILEKESPENLKKDLAIAPEWVRKILRKVLTPDQYES